LIIRCEKCSTVYELDDHLVPAGGVPVQCSRCQFVFTARREDSRPPQAAAAARPPAGGAPAESASPTPFPTAPPQQTSPAPSRPVRRVEMESVEREDAQRMAQAAASRLEASGPPAARRPPSGKRWLWPALVAALLAAGVALYAWRASSGPASAAKPAAGAR
jgi:predicted Zn finger-like uncharacterized protein